MNTPKGTSISVAVKTIEEYLTAWKQMIVDNYIKTGQRTTGRTIGTLQVEMTDMSGKLTAWQYFAISETGRRAGKVPMGFAQIIAKWAEAKGINISDGNYLSFGYRVAAKIRKEGTLLYRQGGRKDVYSNVITDRNMDLLTEALGHWFLANVSSTFDNLINENK